MPTKITLLLANPNVSWNDVEVGDFIEVANNDGEKMLFFVIPDDIGSVGKNHTLVRMDARLPYTITLSSVESEWILIRIIPEVKISY